MAVMQERKISDWCEAGYWSSIGDGGVRCELCPHRCCIAENDAGICGWRVNRGGALKASGYGRISSTALDPIEKKPLYMFHPGKHILSIGGYGCNLRCRFCQNHEISTVDRPAFMEITRKHGAADAGISPDDIVRLAVRTVPEGNIGVAYTYNEPLINYEFLFDCARLVRGAGLYNVIVTNGYINKEPLLELLPFIDAMNIDLKGFTEAFYEKVGGTLEAVKETIEAAQDKCHVEVTTLVIPGENEDDVPELSKWLGKINAGVPLHLTRFFPRYRYSGRQPTPVETIYRLRETAKTHLENVFAGNV